MREGSKRCAAGLLLFLWVLTACTRDEPDTPSTQPAQSIRVVTLAPHLAELVVSVGAEATLVGVSAYTDFPPQLQQLPIVGDGFRVDPEALLQLVPDVVLVWGGGTAAETIENVRRLGFRVEVLPTRTLAEVASTLEAIGSITGHELIAQQKAAAFRQGIAALRTEAEVVSVFYQIDKEPLFTISGEHFISELITLCGGRNIFKDLSSLAPAVSVESVLQANPDVILAAGKQDSDVLSHWRRWDGLTVNKADTRLIVPRDLVARPSLRLVDGGQAICARLAEARELLASSGAGESLVD